MSAKLIQIFFEIGFSSIWEEKCTVEAAGAVSVSVFSKTIKVNASSARPSMQIAGLHCIVTFNWVKDYQMISNGTSSKRVEKCSWRKYQLFVKKWLFVCDTVLLEILINQLNGCRWCLGMPSWPLGNCGCHLDLDLKLKAAQTWNIYISTSAKYKPLK